MADDARKILVVDDEPDCLEFVRAILEPEGYTVATAANGQEALDQIEADAPDLVVLDVMMPVLDGFDACEEIKSNEATEHIPVVLLTRVASEVPTSSYSHRGGMATAADDYIPKPIQPDKVLEVVRRLLGQGAAS